MKKIIILSLLLATTFVTFSQETFIVKGETKLVSYFQGGVQLSPVDKMSQTYSNVTLLIIRYNGEEEYSAFVKEVTSDNEGKFELLLPEGSYGFITKEQKKYLKTVKGLYMPINIKGDQMQDFEKSDYWTLSSYNAFEVIKGEPTFVTLTRNQISSCGMCP